MAAKYQDNNEPLAEAASVQGELLEAEAAPQQVEVHNNDDAQQELERLKQQAQDNLDVALRAQAELDNFRKRSLRDVENAHKYALEKFANELLPVIDSMELGLSAADSGAGQDSFREGMDLTLTMLRSVLVKYGVEEVPSEAQKFDPEKHEAVSMQEVAGSEPGTVVKVLQKGYSLNGRLIRPAIVIVAK